jgi:hypothetical protein
VLLVTSLEGAVFFFGEGPPFFAPGFFKEGGAVREGGSDFAGEVGTGIRVVFFVGVGEIRAESG